MTDAKAKRKAYDAARPKRTEQKKAWRAKNREKERARDLRLNYGLTVARYDAMFQEQQGLCLLCQTSKLRLDVDHNHQTGQVRGLLCRRCNMGLGYFHDNPARLRAAARYLEDAQEDSDDPPACK